MSEYIDREKVYIMLNAVIEGDEDEEVLKTLERAKRFIADIPAVPVKFADKELVDAALRLKAYCTDHGGNCGGCPFFRPFASHDLAINDCRLCDVYPEKWEIGEEIGNE